MIRFLFVSGLFLNHHFSFQKPFQSPAMIPSHREMFLSQSIFHEMTRITQCIHQRPPKPNRMEWRWFSMKPDLSIWDGTKQSKQPKSKPSPAWLANKQRQTRRLVSSLQHPIHRPACSLHPRAPTASKQHRPQHAASSRRLVAWMVCSLPPQQATCLCWLVQQATSLQQHSTQRTGSS